MPSRCSWCGDDPLYVDYHDSIWGRPVASSRELFAKLCLDGQQAGLSWITVLRKQKNYEQLFFGFDPEKIITLTDADIETLMQNPGIIRNRLKVNSIIRNARAYLAMRDRGMAFNRFIWQFVDGEPVQNEWRTLSEVPVNTPRSDAMSIALKKQGFNFVGSTICYAFMQAVGLVNDHLTGCHCHEACRTEGQAFTIDTRPNN
ncbi:MAG: DNA-3-methyladenine glycosylase I [Proteobacteria bacterium]|nr:MAG: DNA-3-methyladenine glycosylase I [Pseudomonadota bacterium]